MDIYIYIYNIYTYLGFLNALSLTLIDKQTLIIPLNEKIAWFTHLKQKDYWDLMLKMVFRYNLLYFASLIVYMDELYLGNVFRTLFVSFYGFYCLLLLLLSLLLFCCCYCRCCCFWFRYFIIIIIITIVIIIFFHYICSYYLRLC